MAESLLEEHAPGYVTSAGVAWEDAEADAVYKYLFTYTQLEQTPLDWTDDGLWPMEGVSLMGNVPGSLPGIHLGTDPANKGDWAQQLLTGVSNGVLEAFAEPGRLGTDGLSTTAQPQQYQQQQVAASNTGTGWGAVTTTTGAGHVHQRAPAPHGRPAPAPSAPLHMLGVLPSWPLLQADIRGSRSQTSGSELGLGLSGGSSDELSHHSGIMATMTTTSLSLPNPSPTSSEGTALQGAGAGIRAPRDEDADAGSGVFMRTSFSSESRQPDPPGPACRASSDEAAVAAAAVAAVAAAAASTQGTSAARQEQTYSLPGSLATAGAAGLLLAGDSQQPPGFFALLQEAVQVWGRAAASKGAGSASQGAGARSEATGPQAQQRVGPLSAAVRSTVGVTKPYRDKKRENRELIKKLEQEVERKLTLVSSLSGQNELLKRKERLLQISVRTSEDTLSNLTSPSLDKNLTELIKSFKVAISPSVTHPLVARIANIKSPKDLTLQDFRTVYNAMVMEMSDVIMAESLAQTPQEKEEQAQRSAVLHERVVSWIMACCALPDCCMVVKQAQTVNMRTGEPTDIPISFWGTVLDKLGLSSQQVQDMVSAFTLFMRCMLQHKRELVTLMAQLDACVKMGQTSWAQGSCDTSIPMALQALHCSMLRAGMLYLWISFLYLRIMTPSQCLAMTIHASPYFPNLHTMGLELHKRTVGEQAHAELMASCSWPAPGPNQPGGDSDAGATQAAGARQQGQQEPPRSQAEGSTPNPWSWSPGGPG